MSPTWRERVNRLFQIVWRLAVLALPWQTRWFHDATLAGWPWEQGRWAIYASWFLLAGAILLGLKRFQRNVNCSVVVLVLFSIISILRNPLALTPIVQWWIQVVLLGLFVWTLWRNQISRRSIATWFSISLIPEVLLGFWQYATQTVFGSKWLGIAEHLVATPGTSVIEHGIRTLRIYGGFPHPNIFGGWLAVGLIVSMQLALSTISKQQKIFAIGMSALISMALLLTYSRNAWIAAIVGLILLIRPLLTKEGLGRWILAAIVIPVLILGFIQRDLIFSRADTSSRLEAKSINTREESLRDGIDMFRRHPLVGSGPNAELLTTAPVAAPAPLEPPHNVFLLILDDVGLIGAAIIGWLIWSHRKKLIAHCSLFVPLFILATFDHYLWSTWSGQALFAMAVLFVLTD